MLEKTVPVYLPEATFRRLQRTAALTHRSVEEILSSALNETLSVPPDVPEELQDELRAMAHFKDSKLLTVARSAWAVARQERLRELNQAAGAGRLNVVEQQEQARLLDLYQHAVLRRARALALLAFRGYTLPERTDWNGDDFQTTR